jgi:hypothetical protein
MVCAGGNAKEGRPSLGVMRMAAFGSGNQDAGVKEDIHRISLSKRR